MAKKPSPSAAAPKKKAAAAAPVTRTTAVRNSPVPKKVAAKSAAAAAAPVLAKPVEVTYEMIARRAYEIHLSGTGGGELDNWLRAERELRG
jgi:hypothetical protein